jgi:HD-GYP domain-containing protein (c-di-GMP phosphodiesterase class II)
MRFVPVNFLRSGQKVASDLVLSRNRVLLRSGVVLNAALIRKVSYMGIQGIYIDDELSEGINIEEVISHDLKIKTKKEVESLFTKIENDQESGIKEQLNAIKPLIEDIVNEISRNRHVMINVIDLRTFDDYTYSHSLNVAVISAVVGTALKMSKTDVNELAMAGLIHDVRKMFVNRDILNKPGKLTPEEFDHMKKHSELGFQYLSGHFDISANSKIAALQHHEKINGTGYPNNLAGEEIHKYSRIVCVADVYDALMSDRPYRKAMHPSEVIEYIMGGYNTMFDPDIVTALTRKIAPYPVGTCLKLSTGDIGIVVKNNEETSLRPVIKLIVDGKPTENYVDLANDRSALNITVKEIVNG